MNEKISTKIDKQMLINGRWVGADEKENIIHPYDSSSVGSVPKVNKDQVVKSIDSAERAFKSSELTAYDRYNLLFKTARLVEDRAEEIAHILTSEQGKPVSDARSEVDRAVQTLDLSAEQAKRMFGEYVPMDGQRGFAEDHCFTQREALGVVAAITPFNFPINLMAHKIGPAIAAGNSVVGKPAVKTPLSAIALFECLDDAANEINADVPAGLFNIITGSGPMTGDTFVSHDAIKAISFTGSTPVGKYLARNSGMKKITLELGGNDPTIVWSDTDIDAAAKQVIGGACSNAGQVCNSVERVLVHQSVEAELIDSLVEAAEELTVGNPFNNDTDIASMVDDKQFESVIEMFEQSLEQGAIVEYGGTYGGNLGPRTFEPTVLSNVTSDMPVASNETFGPLVPVISVADFDEAITEANNTSYGLEAGVFTQDIDRAKRAADEIQAGGVNINTVSGFRTDHMPYGGFKNSGVGKEGVKYAVKHFSKAKLIGFHSGFTQA